MNERDNPQNPAADEREDYLLRTFVRMVDLRGLEIGITLSVGGMLISGTLTSYSEYLKLVGEGMRGSPNREVGGVMGEVFANLAESVQNDLVERRQEEERAESSGQELEHDFKPPYIHLRDAKFFLAADMGLPTQGGALWRGKLASVDGFFFGSFTPPMAPGNPRI